MCNSFTFEENSSYYCKECDKLMNYCYELENNYMCPQCFNDIKVIPENKVKAFIRYKRLQKINSISE